MVRRSISSTLAALGFDAQEERLYQRMLPLSGRPVGEVATALDCDASEVEDVLAPLLDRDVAHLERGVLRVRTLAGVVTAFLEREAEEAQRSRDRLVELATAIPFLAGSAARPGPGEVEEISQLDGEVTRGGDPLFLLTKMIQESRGDMLWLRPDAWRMPRESAVSQAVGAAIASGRRSRAIYPVRALHEASDALLTRARMGEQIRVISELPTRMIVLGTTHAVIPEPLGMADEPRLLVRQRGVVEALTMLFELLWDRAAPVPELDLGEARPDLRRFLLQQLAAGAKDEQIARTLGISLRTVRRRVAGLLIELGVDTRFQAGAEAVRRGWL